MIGDSGFHRGRDTQRSMNPGKIVMHRVERD